MRELIILGTGVHAAEMAHTVERINRDRPTWTILGHVSPKATDRTEYAGHAVLGSAERLDGILGRHPLAAVVADNEFPAYTLVPAERWATLIDPACYVHPTARIGSGCVIYPNGFIGMNAALGHRVFLLAGCIVNHDDVLDDRVVAASGVTLAGFVHVETGAYLGQGSSVRQGLRVGRHSVIGMGAVVVRNVEADSVMAGNPARLLRTRTARPTGEPTGAT